MWTFLVYKPDPRLQTVIQWSYEKHCTGIYQHAKS